MTEVIRLPGEGTTLCEGQVIVLASKYSAGTITVLGTWDNLYFSYGVWSYDQAEQQLYSGKYYQTLEEAEEGFDAR